MLHVTHHAVERFIKHWRRVLEAVEAERFRLAERVESECATRNAEAIVAAWWRGAFVRPKALRRARRVLGLTE